MRQRLAQLTLFFIPLTLLVGERPLVRVHGAPLFWFEALTVLFVGLVWPELQKNRKEQLTKLPRTLKWGVALLLPALAISVWAAGNRIEAFSAAVTWFIVPAALAAAVTLSRTPVLPLVYGVVVHALAQTAYGLQLLPAQEESRLMGTFASPNFYAATAVPALFLAFVLPGLVRWLAVGILAVGLVLSQSLGGFLGLIGGGMYLLFTLVRQPKLRWGLGALTLLFALLGGYLAWERFSNNPRSSLESRKEIWQVAWSIGKERPVQGVGLRGFDEMYIARVPTVTATPIEWGVPEPHNLYLAFWLDLSLLGLLAMVLVLVGTLSFGGLVAAPVVVLLSHGLVDTPVFKLELAVLFWIYLAILATSRGGKSRDLLG